MIDNMLSEAVQAGAVIDNGAIRMYVGKNMVMVEDLKYAGKKHKKSNLFIINRPARNSDADGPINRVVNWLKRARTYAQALTVAKEAVEEAEGIAATEGVQAPYLEQYEQGSHKIAPVGTPDDRNPMLGSVGNRRRGASFFGRLVSTTKKDKVHRTPEADKTRPKEKRPLRSRGYKSVDQDVPNAGQAPKKDNVVKATVTFQLHGPGNKKLGQVQAMNATQALKISGYKVYPLDSKIKSFMDKIGVPSSLYGTQVSFDIEAGVMAISKTRVSPMKSGGGEASVISLSKKKKPDKTFKQGQKVKDKQSGGEFIYLFRYKKNGGFVYILASLDHGEATPGIVYAMSSMNVDDLVDAGNIDKETRSHVISLAHEWTSGANVDGEFKSGVAKAYKKFVKPVVRKTPGKLPSEGAVETDPEFVTYDIKNNGKIIGKAKTGRPVDWMKNQGYRPDRLNAAVEQVLAKSGLGFLTYGNMIVISFEDGKVTMIPPWSPIWTPSERKTVLAGIPKLFKAVAERHDKDVSPSSETTADRSGDVAEIIYKQMGGNKFRVMTGAKNFLKDKNSLSFSIPKAQKGINFVKITLNSMDLYDVEFGKKSKSARIGYKVVAKYDDAYNDMLRDLFEKETGLYTSL